MTELSTKPYLIRAIYEWCADVGFTPYIGVHVDQNTRVPLEYVKNGEIVLSIGMQATRDLTIGNDLVQFSARFGGVSREIAVPIYAIASIFARENGKGMYFEPELPPLASASSTTPNAPPPALQAVPKRALATTPTPAPASISGVGGGLQNNEGEQGNAAADVSPSPSASQGEGHDATSRTDIIAEATEDAGNTGSIDDDKPPKPKGPPRGKLRVIK